MKASGVVLDLNEKKQCMRIYTGFRTNTSLLAGQICNIRKSIKTSSLNITLQNQKDAYWRKVNASWRRMNASRRKMSI